VTNAKTKNNTKTIIFDIGGVVIEYNNSLYYSEIAKETGTEERIVKEKIEKRLLPLFDKGEISTDEFTKGIANMFGISKGMVRWYENFVENAKINKSTIKVIRRLSKRYTLAYFSNVDYSRYGYLLKLMQPYKKLFKYRFASCTIGMRKPEARAYRYVLSKMHVHANETIFIDNEQRNVLGAEAVGIKSILFKNNTELVNALRKMGVL